MRSMEQAGIKKINNNEMLKKNTHTPTAQSGNIRADVRTQKSDVESLQARRALVRT